MKKTFCLALAALTLTGCASRYEMVLNNGTHITSFGKPTLVDNSYYVYKDAEGRTQKIPSLRIRTISPQDSWNSDPKKNFYNVK
jgi:uncharacterized protein YcfL